MGLSDHMSENISNNGQHGTWGARSPPPAGQWEPDHEPPMDGKPDVLDVGTHCCSEDSRSMHLPALDGRRQQSPPSNPPNPLAPLNHHNQLTRFLSKQTLGYIPKLSVRSPERTISPPGVYGGMPREGGTFTFTESPRSDSSLTSPSFRLPRLSGTPPLSPQKWTASPFFSRQDDAPSSEGRPSLPSFGLGSGVLPKRADSFSESCSSPIPPLKRAHNETSHHAMSIADLCQPFRYMRSQSCPSDTQNAGADTPATKPEGTECTSPEPNWRPSLKPQAYMRTQSCHGDPDTFRTHAPVSGPPSLEEELQRGRLQRSNSMDAPLVLAMLNHKRSAAESIDLHQWLDRPSRSSLSSLADSADSMHQLEQAGQSMRISDSPRSDAMTPSDAKPMAVGDGVNARIARVVHRAKVFAWRTAEDASAVPLGVLTSNVAWGSASVTEVVDDAASKAAKRASCGKICVLPMEASVSAVCPTA
ncbi:hypothetical protein JM18_001533 [Phytophthora kernoviae]|uniref:Uncharacterized protein n=2 Tax=Phytophthora kernoviae TaxID=325452 RepID=A0A921VF08_9STRA|nr:hypothetical protein G195_002239 [Phytophthora kernoviae 00238/432]KAG2531894.1 hypothetical protein JM18_001533 [Phytophthora kernoviae]